jgi:hypothetical protein
MSMLLSVTLCLLDMHIAAWLCFDQLIKYCSALAVVYLCVSSLCTYTQTDLIDCSDGSTLTSTSSSSDAPAVLQGAHYEQFQTRHMTLDCTLQSLAIGSTGNTLQQPAAAATAETTANTGNSSSGCSSDSRVSVLQQPLPLRMAVVKPNGSEEHAAAIEQVRVLIYVYQHYRLQCMQHTACMPCSYSALLWLLHHSCSCVNFDELCC